MCPGWNAGCTYAQCSLDLLVSSHPLTSASQVTRTTGAHHHAQIIFVFFVETRFAMLPMAGLKLLGSSNSPASTSQSVGITGMRYCALPRHLFEEGETQASQSKGPHVSSSILATP